MFLYETVFNRVGSYLTILYLEMPFLSLYIHAYTYLYIYAYK